ncbi:innexin inx2-like [Daphnia pulex]|uniref:innexin inx2-like n=1 Tax=Daphnia pulex TaxID=6669 RepID=UPI001EDCA17B|nr:innexin inx2-like [Daphnia pulex]XP_046445812.1 innexin inx2-like [Daphnia pulex]XP_046445813.1 innexin inx2-like [Daphnia pulex]XP_046445815.1 innexin inx2-like [Daphnia pulex]
MLGTFSKLKAAIKLKTTSVKITTPVFALHYRLTFLVLLTSSILVTSRQYIGEHIQCIQDAVAVPIKILNNYCFISSTFSIPRTTPIAKGEISLFGLGPYTEEDDVTYHAYYQWVPFVLFGQALMFYTPYYLWKMWEGTKVRNIIQGMHIFTIKEKIEVRDEKEEILTKYIVRNLHEHNGWAIRFFVCELLNLVNVIGQIFLTNRFLGGEFLRYGIEVVEFLDQDPETRVDPMARVFPRLTKCVFHKYGSSGTIQRHDALCILALNIINEKIYTFLWFWFIILAIITSIDFLARVVIVMMPPVRMFLLRSRLSAPQKDDADVITQRCSIGDWLLVDFLSKNMDTMVFSNVVGKLAKELEYGSKFTGHVSESTPMMS